VLNGSFTNPVVRGYPNTMSSGKMERDGSAEITQRSFWGGGNHNSITDSERLPRNLKRKTSSGRKRNGAFRGEKTVNLKNESGKNLELGKFRQVPGRSRESDQVKIENVQDRKSRRKKGSSPQR